MKRVLLGVSAVAMAVSAAPTAAAASIGTVPWSPTSPVHLALPTSTPLDPNSASIISAMTSWQSSRQAAGQANLYVNTSTSYSNALVRTTNADPVYDIVVDGDATKTADLARVHIPADAKPAGGTDGQLSIYNASDNSYVDLWGAYHAADGTWHAASGGRVTSTTTSNTVFPNHAKGEYVSASGLALEPYTIKVSELQAGVINHPVAVQIPGLFEDGGISAPAVAHDTWADGKAVTAQTVSVGQRLRLPASLNIDAMNMPTVAKIIAKAVQKYGAIVTDSTSTDANGTMAFSVENPIGFATDPYPALFNQDHRWNEIMDWNILTGCYGACDTFPLAKMQVLPRNYLAPTSTVTWSANAYSTSDFDFTASGAPAGSTMRVTWTRGGQLQQTPASTSMYFYSGSQPGWSNAYAQVLDASGKVISTSQTINP